MLLLSCDSQLLATQWERGVCVCVCMCYRSPMTSLKSPCNFPLEQGGDKKGQRVSGAA